MVKPSSSIVTIGVNIMMVNDWMANHISTPILGQWTHPPKNGEITTMNWWWRRNRHSWVPWYQHEPTSCAVHGFLRETARVTWRYTMANWTKQVVYSYELLLGLHRCLRVSFCRFVFCWFKPDHNPTTRMVYCWLLVVANPIPMPSYQWLMQWMITMVDNG